MQQGEGGRETVMEVKGQGEPKLGAWCMLALLAFRRKRRIMHTRGQTDLHSKVQVSQAWVVKPCLASKQTIKGWKDANRSTGALQRTQVRFPVPTAHNFNSGARGSHTF